VALGTGLVGVLTSCRGDAESNVAAPARPAVAATLPARTLTSGYIPILDCVPLIVAYEKGLFQQHGIKAEKPKLIRAWPALLEAFTSQQILLSHILLPQVIFLRYAQGVKVRSVAFNHTDVVAMLTAKNVPSVFHLGGKVVGCPTWWSPHTGIFQDVLRAAGLRPVVGKDEKDLARDEVAFRVVAPPDMVEGLKSGTIAGCAVSEPFGAGAEVLAGARLVKMSGDVWANHPCCQSVLLEETIQRDRPWAEAVTAAIYAAALWANGNREELAELLGKDGGGYFPMPAKVVARALLKEDLDTYGPQGTGAIMHTNWSVRRVGFVPYPYPSAFGTTIAMMRRMVVDPSAGLPPAIAKLTGQQIARDVVDYELARKGLEAAGGLQAFGVSGADPYQRVEKYEVLLKSR
jgi:NitT/TauT family transport system substrate-binding protein